MTASFPASRQRARVRRLAPAVKAVRVRTNSLPVSKVITRRRHEMDAPERAAPQLKYREHNERYEATLHPAWLAALRTLPPRTPAAAKHGRSPATVLAAQLFWASALETEYRQSARPPPERAQRRQKDHTTERSAGPANPAPHQITSPHHSTSPRTWYVNSSISRAVHRTWRSRGRTGWPTSAQRSARRTSICRWAALRSSCPTVATHAGA